MMEQDRMGIIRWIVVAGIWLLPQALQAQTEAAKKPTTLMEQRAARRAAFRDPKPKKAIARGIEWLVRQQKADGSWDGSALATLDRHKNDNHPRQHTAGITGLATLALLAEADPAYQPAIERAVHWINTSFDTEGKLRATVHDIIYHEAICALALAEYVAIHQPAEAPKSLLPAIQRLLSGRNTGSAWRYTMNDGDNDTSVTSWCIAALMAAQKCGMRIPATAIGEALGFIDSVTDSTGRIGYSAPGEPSARFGREDHMMRFPPELGCATTAAGLHALTCVLPDNTVARSTLGINELMAKPPSLEPKGRDYYAWCHAAQAMVHVKGAAAAKWFGDLDATLSKLQVTDGDMTGSWAPDDVWGEAGGRIASTSLALLALQARYRVIPNNTERDFTNARGLAKVRELLAEKKFSQAEAEQKRVDLASLGDAGTNATWVAEVMLAQSRASVFARIAKIRRFDFRDWVEYVTLLERAIEQYRGTASSEEAASLLRDAENDPKAKPHIDSWRKLKAIQTRIGTRRLTTDSPLYAELRQLAIDYPDTRARDVALQLLQGAKEK